MGGLGAGLRSIQWDLSKLPPFEKNFYIEHPAVTNRGEDESERWKAKHGITVHGHGVPKVRAWTVRPSVLPWGA